MKYALLRRCIAEFIGTFALVFMGCTTRAMLGDTTSFAGILVVHLAFAFTIAAMIYTLSHISAAIFNPALTLGFAVSGRFPWRCVLPALIIEIILTFFLMLVNMSSATDKRFKRADSGLAVGLYQLIRGSGEYAKDVLEESLEKESVMLQKNSIESLLT